MPPQPRQIAPAQDESSSPAMNPRRIKTTTDQIVDYIREAIFDGKFLPGDKLKENEIAQWLSVSRTPVREAFRKLEAEGLAEFQPNKGVQVPLIENQDIDEICEMRTLIELYCIRKFGRLATPRHLEEMRAMIKQMEQYLAQEDVARYLALSIDFHAYYIKHCQNKRMYAAFQNIRNTLRSAQSVLGKNREYHLQSLKEHQNLLQALEARSRDCEKILRLHIEASCERMRQNLLKIRGKNN